jgi:hypothetical protein
MTDKSEANTALDVKSEANTADSVERDETNYNPEAFEPVFKKYELEEKLLEKLRFKTDEDKYVFDRLPLLPTQKLEIVYQLIAEDNDCVECDKELKEDIQRIIGSKTE